MTFDYRKITQEEFNKLPQLDRIELRQKRDWLENHKPKSFILPFFKAMIFIWVSLILLGFGILNYSPESAEKIFHLVSQISLFSIFMFIIFYVLDITRIFFYEKKMNEVYQSYFSQKTEVKKK